MHVEKATIGWPDGSVDIPGWGTSDIGVRHAETRLVEIVPDSWADSSTNLKFYIDWNIVKLNSGDTKDNSAWQAAKRSMTPGEDVSFTLEKHLRPDFSQDGITPVCQELLSYVENISDFDVGLCAGWANFCATRDSSMCILAKMAVVAAPYVQVEERDTAILAQEICLAVYDFQRSMVTRGMVRAVRRKFSEHKIIDYM